MIKLLKRLLEFQGFLNISGSADFVNNDVSIAVDIRTRATVEVVDEFVEDSCKKKL